MTAVVAPIPAHPVPSPQEPQPVGLPLSTFTETFPTVPAAYDAAPVRSFDLLARLAPHERAVVEDLVWDPTGARRLVDIFDPAQHLQRLQWQHLGGLSVAERCMLQSSSGIQADWYDVFANEEGDAERRMRGGRDLPWNPHFRLYGKIANCMWRAAYGKGSWNAIVGVYDALRRFDFGVAGFETRLDWTTYTNEAGYSAYARVYLDGGLGLLVHYRGRHVLTIALNVDDQRNVYVMQVQARQKTGNRWMFKVPGDLLAHVVRQVDVAFGTTFRLHVADGRALAAAIDGRYARLRQAQADAEERRARGGPLTERDTAVLATPTPTATTLAHIAQAYDRPIAGYARGRTTRRAAGIACWPLRRAGRRGRPRSAA